MTENLLKGEHCKWCGRDLTISFLSEVGGIEKNGLLLFPILCVCGGITVIGAGTFVSHFDDLNDDRKSKANRKHSLTSILADERGEVVGLRGEIEKDPPPRRKR